MSMKCSDALTDFKPVEPEIGGQAAAVFPQPRQKFRNVWLPGDRKSPRANHLDLDFVALLQPHGLDKPPAESEPQDYCPM